MAYERILVAVDLTEEADEVLTAARAAAESNAATLATVTVVKPINYAYGGLELGGAYGSPAAFEQEAVEQAKQRLTRLASAYGIEADNVHVQLGNPAREIRQLADTLRADLIVVGTHGRHGLGLLLGSTANGVLHGVECDVLVVRIHPQDIS